MTEEAVRREPGLARGVVRSSTRSYLLMEQWVKVLMDQGKIITAVVSLAVMAATVRADMMPVSGSDAGCLQASPVGGRTSLPQASPARPPFGCSGAFALGLGSLDFLLRQTRM